MDVFDERACQLGESPFYDAARERVYWVDILGQAVCWRELGSGRTGGFGTDGHVGAAVPRTGEGLVLCLPDGPVLRDADGRQHACGTFAEADVAAGDTADGTDATSAASPARRANDAKADPAGRLWVGTATYDEVPEAAALYRLDPDASTPRRVLDQVTVSNGLGWSPDGGLLYYADTPTGRIDVFDFDAARGELSGRRVFATVDPEAGLPDGLCVDAGGGVWVALWGGGAVHRYTPDGALDRVVTVPTPLASACAFVGPAFELLVVTTASVAGPEPGAGMTYAHRPEGVSGLPPYRFAA